MPRDILIDQQTGDLAAKGGDFIVGESTAQHQGDLLWAVEGEYKQSVTLGVGIEGYLLDEDKSDLLRKIRRVFLRDGMNVNRVSAGSKITIKASYV